MSHPIQPLSATDYRNVVVLTGAGISVASGLPTFRGPGGLWERSDARMLTGASLQSDPAGVWRVFNELRERVLAAQPNPAHAALAAYEGAVASKGGRFTLVTQNVDGLHQLAGSQTVVELHGGLFRSRCSSASCATAPFRDAAIYREELPTCASCGSLLRPDVVLFEEVLDAKAEWETKRALRDCDLFLAIGTSGTVSPASGFVRSAAYAGARTIYVNLEPMTPPHPDFREQVLGPAEVTLPRLLGVQDA